MKKIAYVTGSRAEYGIVKRLLKKWQDDQNIEFSLLVTAMHLDPQYGNTVNIIESDGFQIAEKFPITLDSKNNATIIYSMAECLSAFGKHFQTHKYDAIVILGDRYEIFAVATAAAMHNLPIIHLHGGEQTLGNYDEFIRHSITKMAKLHLTSTEEYRQRVIQLGEFPDSVYNIGSLGAENGLSLTIPTKAQLTEKLNISTQPYFMVVFHPETLNESPVVEQIENLLSALDHFKTKYQFVFIGSNSDTHSDIIFEKIHQYTQKNGYRFLTSVKPEEYLGLIKYSMGIIGNSSSGLLEAPSFKVGTINIGNRQQGRVRGESVIDVTTQKDDIVKGIEYLLSPIFQAKLPHMQNPYYQPKAMENAYQIINRFLDKKNINNPKAFYDIKY